MSAPLTRNNPHRIYKMILTRTIVLTMFVCRCFAITMNFSNIFNKLQFHERGEIFMYNYRENEKVIKVERRETKFISINTSLRVTKKKNHSPYYY